jgi:hypothetical protein
MYIYIYIYIYIYSGSGRCRRYGDSLRNVRSGDRIPVGARFYAPVKTYPAAHPAFYLVGTRSFPGVKRPVCGIEHLPPYSAKVKEQQTYTSAPFLGLFVACSKANFTLYCECICVCMGNKYARHV